jgi:hypothetical protein
MNRLYIFYSVSTNFWILFFRGKGIINGKAGKAAALPEISDKLTLFQPGEAD